jgi:hypothetical protein
MGAISSRISRCGQFLHNCAFFVLAQLFSSREELEFDASQMWRSLGFTEPLSFWLPKRRRQFQQMMDEMCRRVDAAATAARPLREDENADGDESRGLFWLIRREALWTLACERAHAADSAVARAKHASPSNAYLEHLLALAVSDVRAAELGLDRIRAEALRRFPDTQAEEYIRRAFEALRLDCEL